MTTKTGSFREEVMRTLRIAAVGLSLWLALGTLASADPPELAAKPASSGSLWWPPNWFATKATTKVDNSSPTARVDERAKIAAASRYYREQAEKAFLRRQAVCDKLDKIGEDTSDEALRRMARTLADRAWMVYLQRTASGPVAGNDLNGASRLLDASSERGSAASLLPGSTALLPGAGQANLRRD
jgi:hypothetical protein